MNTKYYNPVLGSCLTRCIQARDWNQLYSVLDKLSNTDFRNAEGYISEMILPEENADGFWLVYNQLIRYRSKSFMVCIARSTGKLVSKNRFTLRCNEAKEVFEYVNSLDADTRTKFVKMLFPLLKTEEEADEMVKNIALEGNNAWLKQCMICGTQLSYYMLFKLLRQTDADNVTIVNCIKNLVKTNTDKAFNTASILQSYFGVEKQHGVYALKLQPYEINYLDSSFTNFLKVLNRI